MKAPITVKSIPGFVPQEKPFEVADRKNKGLVLRVQPSGATTFYGVYRLNGRNIRFRIGSAGKFEADDNGKHRFTPDIHPDVARAKLAELRGEASKGNDPAAERKRKRTEAKTARFKTVGGFFEHHYRSFLETERKSGKLTARRMVSCFEEYLFNRPMAEVTPFLLQSWRKKRFDGGKSPITVNRDLADLKAMLAKAVELGFIAAHPLAKLKPAKAADNSRTRHLSPDERKRLLDALDAREKEARQARERFNVWRKERHLDPLPEIPPEAFTDHLKPLVLLALNTGLRRGELFSLEWRDIDFLHNRLTVRAAAAKGGKTRHIPLNPAARGVLLQWQKQTGDTGLIFPGADGKRLDNIATSWRNLITAAGIQDFTFHDLRHSFATAALRGGADIVTVSKLLGHASLKMTLRYAHVTDDALVEAVAQI